MAPYDDPQTPYTLSGGAVWDGQKWCIGPPAAYTQRRPQQPGLRSRRTLGLAGILLFGLTIAGVALGGYALAFNSLHPKPTFAHFAGPGAPLALGPAVAAAAAFANPIAQTATANAVRVVATGCESNGWDLGSGWPVSETQVVTNAHVVGGSDDIEVQVPGGAALLAVVVAINFTDDVAVISVPGAHFVPMRLAQSDPAPGTVIAAIGYPSGGSEQFLPGTVLSTGKDRKVHSVPYYSQSSNLPGVTHGSSGSEVIDISGTVVGMVFAGGGTEGELFVPPSHMRGLIERVQENAEQTTSGHCVDGLSLFE